MRIRNAREGDCLPPGAIVEDGQRKCDRCGGLGAVESRVDPGVIVECPDCDGWGLVGFAE